MEKITGVLKCLGNSTVSKDGVVYTTIEMDDRVIQEVSVSNTLDTFLSKGLSSDQAVTIWIKPGAGRRQVLEAVELPDGKRYVDRFSAKPFITLAFIGVLLIGALGLGLLILLWLPFAYSSAKKKHQAFVAEHPNTIVLG
jgi:hypothetical protein